MIEPRDPEPSGPVSGPPGSTAAAIVCLVRPRQWIKNLQLMGLVWPVLFCCGVYVGDAPPLAGLIAPPGAPW